MSVYSSLDVYPADADELFDCESQFCDDCSFDCHKEEDDLLSYLNNLQYEINTIFSEKGFRSGNRNYVQDDPCLTIYLSEAKKFRKHMEEYGYNVIIGPGHNEFWATVLICDEFGVVDPKDLLDIFRAMEGI